MTKGVNFFCQPYGANLGIPVHTRELAKALSKKVDLKLVPIFPSMEKLEPSLQSKVGRFNKDWDNFIFWYPDSFAELPDTGTKRIGYYIFEYTVIPKNFIEQINKLDVICTASEWGVKVLKDNGVTIPCKVVRGGVDHTRFNSEGRKPLASPFRFLHIGKAEQRKGTEILIRAFNDVFDGSKDVRLTLSINNPHIPNFNAKQFLRNLSYELKNPIDNIDVIDFIPNIINLYKTHHVAVFPTKAEGLGLPVVEAMSSGMLTIVSLNSGITEYAKETNSILLSKLVEEPIYDEHFFPNKGQFGTWMSPTIEELKEKLLMAYKQYGEFSAIAKQGEEDMKNNFTWEQSANSLLSLL